MITAITITMTMATLRRVEDERIRNKGGGRMGEGWREGWRGDVEKSGEVAG